ncbi:MAG: CehA/McbA family metallohydrolase [Planctomycetota bacterium]|nr:CehA/McbA family metallohydrolase [Planctomycetota bacterium]
MRIILTISLFLGMALIGLQNIIAAQDLLSENACKTTLYFQLAGDGGRVNANIRITEVGNQTPLDLSTGIKRPNGWYTFSSGNQLTLPPSKYVLESFHGLETRLHIKHLDLTASRQKRIHIKLLPFTNSRKNNLVSANTHLHLMRITHAEMIDYIQQVPFADDLDILYVSNLRRIPDETDYITNTLTPADLQRLSTRHVQLGFGEEHRHNFGRGGEGFGHVMLLGIPELVKPVSIGPGIMRTGSDGRPLQKGIQATRAHGGTVVWCHNSFGNEDIPNWVAGTVDAQNIFDGGSGGSYDVTFYKYLNIGMRVPFSSGTDWFMTDFSRVYVPLRGEASSSRFLEQLRNGRSFITNGPLLDLKINGHPIGAEVAAGTGQSLHVIGQAIGRADFKGLQLICNGEVIDSTLAQSRDGFYSALLKKTIPINQPGWYALRIPLETSNNLFNEPLYAHTSPVYFSYNGRHVFQSEVAVDLLKQMQASRAFVTDKGIFATEDEFQAVKQVYDRGIRRLQQQIADQPD